MTTHTQDHQVSNALAVLRTRMFGKYAALSAATVVTGHVLLYSLHSLMGVEPVMANLLSTAINTVFVFVTNRRWVWNVDGRVRLRSEVLPFIALAVAGLALSTLFVWATAETIGEGLWINAANQTAFGIVWLARFFVLDRWVYPTSAA